MHDAEGADRRFHGSPHARLRTVQGRPGRFPTFGANRRLGDRRGTLVPSGGEWPWPERPAGVRRDLPSSAVVRRVPSRVRSTRWCVGSSPVASQAASCSSCTCADGAPAAPTTCRSATTSSTAPWSCSPTAAGGTTSRRRRRSRRPCGASAGRTWAGSRTTRSGSPSSTGRCSSASAPAERSAGSACACTSTVHPRRPSSPRSSAAADSRPSSSAPADAHDEPTTVRPDEDGRLPARPCPQRPLPS